MSNTENTDAVVAEGRRLAFALISAIVRGDDLGRAFLLQGAGEPGPMRFALEQAAGLAAHAARANAKHLGYGEDVLLQLLEADLLNLQ